jgi:hypothetical protein
LVAHTYIINTYILLPIAGTVLLWIRSISSIQEGDDNTPVVFALGKVWKRVRGEGATPASQKALCDARDIIKPECNIQKCWPLTRDTWPCLSPHTSADKPFESLRSGKCKYLKAMEGG